MLLYVPTLTFVPPPPQELPCDSFWLSRPFHSSWPIWSIVSPMYPESIITQCPFPLNASRKISNSVRFFCVVTVSLRFTTECASIKFVAGKVALWHAHWVDCRALPNWLWLWPNCNCDVAPSGDVHGIHNHTMSFPLECIEENIQQCHIFLCGDSIDALHDWMYEHGVCSRRGRPLTRTLSGLSCPSELALALAQL